MAEASLALSPSTVDHGTYVTVSAVAVLTTQNAWNEYGTAHGNITINGNKSSEQYAAFSGYSTKNIMSHSVNVNKTTSAQTISMSSIFYTQVYPASVSASNSVTVPALASYAISYNANGGTGAPGAGTKWYGSAYSISSTVPTRSDGTATGYTVTFNGNEGTPAISQLTSRRTIKYSFRNWLSSSDGASYNPRDSYTRDAATTFTAQWNLSYVNHSVTLPSAVREGHRFTGWFTAAIDGERIGGAGNTYTPNANITLYAQWEPLITTNIQIITLGNQALLKYGEVVYIEEGKHGFVMMNDNIIASNSNVALVKPQQTE